MIRISGGPGGARAGGPALLYRRRRVIVSDRDRTASGARDLGPDTAVLSLREYISDARGVIRGGHQARRRVDQWRRCLRHERGGPGRRPDRPGPGPRGLWDLRRLPGPDRRRRSRPAAHLELGRRHHPSRRHDDRHRAIGSISAARGPPPGRADARREPDRQPRGDRRRRQPDRGRRVPPRMARAPRRAGGEGRGRRRRLAGGILD